MRFGKRSRNPLLFGRKSSADPQDQQFSPVHNEERDALIFNEGAVEHSDPFEPPALAEASPMSTQQDPTQRLLTALGPLTFALIQRHVDAIWTVSEEAIIDAMRLVFERLKLVIEPSAAVCLGALLESPERGAGQRVGIILSGGNADLDRLPW